MGGVSFQIDGEISPVVDQKVPASAIHHYQEALRKARPYRGGSNLDSVGRIRSAANRRDALRMAVRVSG